MVFRPEEAKQVAFPSQGQNLTEKVPTDFIRFVGTGKDGVSLEGVRFLRNPIV